MRDKFLYLFFCLFCFSCTPNGPKIQKGDILFLASGSSDLAKAISEATQTKDSTNFFHIGIANIENDTLVVYHASSELGVCRQSLADFSKNKKGEKFQVYQFRLKAPYQKTISAALEKAPNYLGQPYNFTYILEDSGLYCSEYIYTLFEADTVFHLNPMHFTAENSDSILSTWKNYYDKMGIAVPEGKPGCNPNGMAAESVLEFIGVLD